MDLAPSLQRPLLLPTINLPSIQEGEVEKEETLTRQPRSLPTILNHDDDSDLVGQPKEIVKSSKRVTWGGKDTRKASPRMQRKTVGVNGKSSDSRPYPRSLMSYNLLEDGYGLEDTGNFPNTRYEHLEVSETHENERSSTFTESGEGIIDGRVDVRSFVSIEPPYGGPAMSTSKELELCKRTVLKPYLTFLKVIGWRRWRGERQDLSLPKSVKLLNIIYPSVIFLMMVVACVTQVLTCFFRDEASYDRHRDEDTNIVLLECTDHIFTRIVLGDMLLLATFLAGLYIFRYGEPEHISTLMETVYLSFNFMHRIKPHKKTTYILRFILVCGVLWIFFSLAGNILRLVSLRLLHDNTYIKLITFQNTSITSLSQHSHTVVENSLRYSLVIFSILGFLLFDLLYVAVVITYTSEAELLLTYITSVIDKVQTKAYDLGNAIKDMGRIYEFLKIMNGKLSNLTSLCLFIFLTAVIFSIFELTSITTISESEDILILSVGIMNVAQWAILTMAPILQASRLTSRCKGIRRLGLQVGTRSSYAYASTPQLVLDSFLQYTSATQYSAKLAYVPMYPSYVIGFLFLFGLLIVYAVSYHSLFTFAAWF